MALALSVIKQHNEMVYILFSKFIEGISLEDNSYNMKPILLNNILAVWFNQLRMFVFLWVTISIVYNWYNEMHVLI